MTTPLRERMTEDMKIRNLALNTQKSYLEQVSRFARYFGKSPAVLGQEDIRTYQFYLTQEKKLAPGSIVIAVSALRFLYKVTLRQAWDFDDMIPAPKTPKKLPVILSPRGGSGVSRLRVGEQTSHHSDHLLCRRLTYLRSRLFTSAPH